MNFFINYWGLILISFIIIMLITLFILISRNEKKGKIKTENISDSNPENKKLQMIYKSEDNKNDLSVNDGNQSELEYDELDVLNIDDEFKNIISEKQLIDDEFKKSVDSIRIDKLKLKEKKNIYNDDIVLPEIKYKNISHY